jgi:DNA polymerase-1
MATLYPSSLYLKILEYRKTGKLLGTYTSWPVDKDGRVRTRFSLAPATGRLSSQNPNVQNIPAEGEMADKFRECLIASPGHLLLRRDYTGAEALLTGYFAGDELFMKLARIGVYTYVMAKHMGINLDPNATDLASVLSKLKKENKEPKAGQYISPYKKWKTMVLGICYGLGPDQMFEQNPGMFSSKGETRKMRKFFMDLFPKIEMFQESAVNEAKVSALVKNPFGYIRWLWDVPGLDGPKAIAQKPQSSLAAIIKRAMLSIDREKIGQFMVWQIHDELVLDAPEDSIEETDKEFKEILERPIPELGGLIIRTERKLGRSMRG